MTRITADRPATLLVTGRAGPVSVDAVTHE
jgi:hypothetical protein